MTGLYIILIIFGLFLILGPTICFVLIFFNYVTGRTRTIVFRIGLSLCIFMVPLLLQVREDGVKEGKEQGEKYVEDKYEASLSECRAENYDLEQQVSGLNSSLTYQYNKWLNLQDVELKAEDWIKCLIDLINEEVSDCRPTANVYTQTVKAYGEAYGQ